MGTDILGQWNFAPRAFGSYGGYNLVPGARELYVRSGGPRDQEQSFVTKRLFLTLGAALAQCRSGMGDVVHVLPGHSESVTAAGFLANLVPGTVICGYGTGASMPTFRWTATAGNMALDDSGVCISGLRLRMEGANGITSAINVSAADCCIYNCDIEVASGATAKATVAITVAAGADRFAFCNNLVRGTATHNVTDGILISGAALNVRICENHMFASATAANGLIRTTAATLGLLVLRNNIANTHTNSTACIAIGAQASTGMVAHNNLSVLADGTGNATGITFGAGSLIRAFENYNADEPNRSGVLSPAVVAT